jgi:hypothetical protein
MIMTTKIIVDSCRDYDNSDLIEAFEDNDESQYCVSYECWGCAGCDHWHCYVDNEHECLKGHELRVITVRGE